MTKQITTADPIFIEIGHYQIPSLSAKRAGTIYDLRYNFERKRWECNCYDAVEHADIPSYRCKHVKRLVQYILAKQNADAVQAQATAIVEQPQTPTVEEEISNLKAVVYESARVMQELLQEVDDLKLKLQEQDAIIAQLQAAQPTEAIDRLAETIKEAVAAMAAKAAKPAEPKLTPEQAADKAAWEEFEQALERDPVAARKTLSARMAARAA